MSSVLSELPPTPPNVHKNNTRTLTIAAIIGEAIGTTEMIIPLAVSCLIARTITKALAGHTVDEFQIHEKDLFFLNRYRLFLLSVAVVAGGLYSAWTTVRQAPALLRFALNLATPASKKRAIARPRERPTLSAGARALSRSSLPSLLPSLLHHPKQTISIKQTKKKCVYIYI